MSQLRATKRPRHVIQSDLQPTDDDSNPTPVTPPAIPDKTPESTPISYKTSATYAHAQRGTRAQERNIAFGIETRGKWVGGMDPNVFLEFLPPVQSDLSRPAFNASAFREIPKNAKEVLMYGPFIEAMSPFGPQLKLVDTHAKVDSRCEGIAVDVSVYQLDSEGQCDIAKCDFSQMEIPIELKPSESLDPFVDHAKVPAATEKSPYLFEGDTRVEHNEIRGQIAAYSSALIGAQFRLHCFSVFIAGEWARLLRWDRNGVIVSKRFLYAEVDTLVEFFWRYSHAPRHHTSGFSRGYDPTVTIYSSPARTPAESDARSQLQKANTAHRDFCLMMIPDRDSLKEYPFLISFPPRYKRHSPFGRATRGGLAFDIEKDKIVYVKDYWRSVGDNLEKEGEIYKIMEDSNVPYLAPFGRGNDIRRHVTYTDTVKSKTWAYPSSKMNSLHHYRMSLDEVGRPLNEFQSSHELVTAVADAMEAHDIAYHDAKILHRDISAGNILITDEGRGMLIDWDLCLNMNKLYGKARRPDRTGTWQFLSVALLLNPAGHVQGVLDDQEAALYVILWCVMRYTRHNRVYRQSEEMELFDDQSMSGDLGGGKKELFLSKRHTEISFNDRPHLDKLIAELAVHFALRYERPIPLALRKFFETEAGALMDPMNPVIRERNLADRFWLVTTMRRHLAPRDEWPKNDIGFRNRDTGGGTALQLVRLESAADQREVGPSSLKRQSSPS